MNSSDSAIMAVVLLMTSLGCLYFSMEACILVLSLGVIIGFLSIIGHIRTQEHLREMARQKEQFEQLVANGGQPPSGKPGDEPSGTEAKIGFKPNATKKE